MYSYLKKKGSECLDPSLNYPPKVLVQSSACLEQNCIYFLNPFHTLDRHAPNSPQIWISIALKKTCLPCIREQASQCHQNEL